MAFISETYLLDTSVANKTPDDDRFDEISIPPVLVVGDLSPHLRCSFCRRIYNDPVISVKCGHTFCRKCAFQCTHCPEDGQHCDTTQLVVNRLVVGQIGDLLIHCRYGIILNHGEPTLDPSGCQEKITYGKRKEHESICAFALVPCPHNAQQCGKFRKSELKQHLQTCCFISCDHQSKGCEFTGTAEDVKKHLEHCGYRGLPKSVSIKDFNDQNRMLEENNRELKEEVKILTQRVELLENGRDKLQTQVNTVISNLQSLRQKYEAQQNLLDQLMSSRNRRSLGSPISSADSTRQRTSSTSSLSSSRRSPPASVKIESWQMPFQFKCIGTLRGHKNVVWCLAMYNRKLCSAGADGLLKVWDLEQLKLGCIKTLEGHTGVVNAMVVMGDLLFTGGEDLTIRSWNMENMTEHSCVQNAHDNIISAMTATPDYLFTASHSLIKVWEIHSLNLKHTCSGLHHWVRALCLNISKDRLYSGSHNTIDIWDTTGTFDLKGKISHKFGSVYSLAVTRQYVIAVKCPKASMLITGLEVHDLGNILSQNVSSEVFDATTFKHIDSLKSHVGTISSLIAAPSGRFLFSSSNDKTIMVWSLENMLPIQTLNRHEGSVNAIVLHGDFLISGSEDREIKVFKLFQMQMGFALQT